ncbi:hypothetical protein ACS0TY_016943 [Phlomoides rotata]
MAETAVSFVMDQVAMLLHEEQQLLGGIKREVESIQDEMGQMNEFLRVALEKDESNPNLKEWIRQLQEIAYDVEDVLDKYMLRLGRRRVSNGCSGGIKKVFSSITNLKEKHQIASEIQDIKFRLQNVTTGQQRYREMNAALNHVSSSVPRTEFYGGRGDALFLAEVDVVGIEKPKKQLLEWIHSMDDGLEVISVVGIGGLGKTTLVKKVYDDESTKRHFNHHIWIVASDYKDVKHMLANLIEKLVAEIKEPPPQNLGGMNVDDMREFIYEFLKGKTYIICVDDVWNISTWDAIKFALPKRGNHGCVVVATRFYSIANAACSETEHVYELKPLPTKESRELFYKRAFPRNQCPHYLKEFAEKILKRCEGLPLAISVISGLLATKENRAEEWEMFERSLGHELIGGGSLEILGKSLFSLSYNDLPYYLKYCYLYLSIFIENGLLEKETIIRLWIGEGFVQPKNGKTTEEVAVDYLNDLFSRSLIHVAKRNVDGRARAFRIHFLLRDYIISKSREHNIVTISNGGEMQWPSRIRRLAIQKNCSFSQETGNLDCLRSLLLLGFGNMELGIVNKVVGRCRLLKVLDLRGAPLETIPNEVFKLYHLKYLSLRSTMVQLIPKSIKYLENLETLDLKNCKVTELPIEILKLHKLRHLIVYRYRAIAVLFDNIQSCTSPCDIGRNFPFLLKLSSIDANESGGIKIVSEVGKLTQLRRLGIAKLRSGDGQELCSSIAKLTNLRSLRIDSIGEDEKLDLDYSVNLQFLRTLILKGCMEKVPKWISCLNGLTTLGLFWSRLKGDPLSSLQDLPNLARLYIHGARVEGLRFKAHGFKKLKELWLRELTCMQWVIVEKGSMASLGEWTTSECKLLGEVPQGMEHLPRLQVVVFANMGDGFVERVVEERRNEGVNWKLAHVAKVRFGNVMDDGNWRFGFAL